MDILKTLGIAEAIRDHGEKPGLPHVAVKPICTMLGLDWSSQSRVLKRHGCGHRLERLAGKDGKRHFMLCYPVPDLLMWLMAVKPAQVAAAHRAALEAFQREASGILLPVAMRMISDA